MVKNFFSALGILVLLIAPLALLHIPLPLAEEFSLKGHRIKLLFIIYMAILLAAIIYYLAGKTTIRKILEKLVVGLTVVLIAYFLLGLFKPTLLPSYPGCVFFVFGIFLLFISYLTVQKKLASSGIIGFLLLIVFVLSVELALRRVPAELLASNVRSTPPLVKKDQVNIIYKKNWFRGKRPCLDCPKELIRIATMGASSTYGVPMHYSSRTYAAQLQRLLDERRPGESYEVLNGGVAAMGIMQIISALNEEVLKYKPDIVTVCEWFNDSASSPRWYRMPGISDREGYKRARALQRLQEFPVYKQLRESKIYALLRFYLLKIRNNVSLSGSPGKLTPKKEKDSDRPRMTPKEYRWGLEEIVRLGKTHDFLPVFIIESYHRSVPLKEFLATNPYVREMLTVAKKHGIPVVDPVTPFSINREPWFFYDFIHPNPAGHALIAESLYDTLFAKEQTAWATEFWQEKGVDLRKPKAVKKPLLQFAKNQLANKNLKLMARAPFSTGSAPLKLFVDTKEQATLNGLSKQFKEFSFPFSSLDKKDPILDIEFATEITAGELTSAPLGETNIIPPAYIEVVSGGKDHGWTTMINVNGKRYDYNLRGYNVVVVGQKSGEVKSTALFDIYAAGDENEKFAEYINNLAQFQEDGTPPIVIVSVKTDGNINVDRKLVPELFSKLGGTGRLPRMFESFVLIGSPGVEKGLALEELGPKLIKVSVGDKNIMASQLIEIAEVSLEDASALE